ncbi:MAG: hypothetical protein GY719_21150 [bacterium]|nr:hypothetical protein [bacterium]
MRSIACRLIIIGILLALMFTPSAVASGDHAEVFRGETLVYEAPYRGDQILVAVKLLGDTGTEAPTVFFRFRTREPLETPLETWTGLAEISYRTNSLVIRGINEDITFAFGMDGKPAHGQVTSGKTLTLNNGVELLWNRPPSAIANKDSEPRASLEELAVNYDAWPVSVSGERQAEFPELIMKGSTDCTAGGVGSTACSVGCTVVSPITPSSCNVSCGAGYYSCCKCTMATAFCECR